MFIMTFEPMLSKNGFNVLWLFRSMNLGQTA